MPEDEYIPEVDSSFGLIYRLNFLWSKVDREALNGNYDKWELVLDTIYRNLLYRNPMNFMNDKIFLSDEDAQQWRLIKQKIREAKKQKIIAIIKKSVIQLNQAKENHYEALCLYDVWVRKFMNLSLKLYMKESERTPSGVVMFGKSFKKKTR